MSFFWPVSADNGRRVSARHQRHTADKITSKWRPTLSGRVAWPVWAATAITKLSLTGRNEEAWNTSLTNVYAWVRPILSHLWWSSQTYGLRQTLPASLILPLRSSVVWVLTMLESSTLVRLKPRHWRSMIAWLRSVNVPRYRLTMLCVLQLIETRWNIVNESSVSGTRSKSLRNALLIRVEICRGPDDQLQCPRPCFIHH